MAEDSNKNAQTPDEVIVDEGSASSSSAENDKVLAAVSAIPLVGLIIYFAMKDASPYVKNYARQGGLLFIAGLVTSFIPIINCIVAVVILVGVVVLVIKALQEDKGYELPLVGDFAKKIFK